MNKVPFSTANILAKSERAKRIATGTLNFMGQVGKETLIFNMIGKGDEDLKDSARMAFSFASAGALSRKLFGKSIYL